MIAKKRAPLTQFSLESHIALVTGAGHGVEIEIVMALAEADATIYFVEINTPSQIRQDRHPRRFTVIGEAAAWGITEKAATAEDRLDICVSDAKAFTRGPPH
ncbi:hypothetical protein FISHEDRAFT_76422 [Fistulina hepatica ATCC 64428]|uniref:Uncharacterized protein n=1 Tax=Fistulina hepatica ATCC 64428 TaxID=1128425 RepID=A0A0D7A3G1_9AGAR|nr:hypothetical protein FISHEDRAFT_76422 [Fistulina hepatica ATCC 64428]